MKNIDFIDRFVVTTIMIFAICVIYSIPNFITVGFETSMICLFGLAIISMHLGFISSFICEVVRFVINVFKRIHKI